MPTELAAEMSSAARARPAGLDGGARGARLRAASARAGARARAAAAATSRASTARASSRTPTTSCSTTTSPGLTTAELRDAVRDAARGARPARLRRRGRPRRGRARLPGPLPASSAQQRFADEVLARGRLRARALAPGPAVHPFARSMAPTDVRLTTRWEEDDLAMAFYSCLHEFGHGLYEAQMDPRALPHDARRRPPGSACTSPRAGCGRTSSAARGRSASGCCRSCAATSAARSRRWTPRELYRAVNQVRLVADPHRGRRDDLQPAHRAALRARARAGRGPAGGRRPARRVERGDAPAARAARCPTTPRASCRTSTGAPG